MREIKFRYWDAVIKRMLFTFCFEERPQEADIKFIMQFTGLLDKNGKEIYEGDIVKSHALKRVVYWKLGGFWTKVLNGEGDCMLWMHDIPDYDMEVIGNIHENPELLEAPK